MHNNMYTEKNSCSFANNSSKQQDLVQNTSSFNNPRRTRITRACDTCRRKKIKCDVDSSLPCTTCRQYDWECTFHDTAKKRGPPKGYIESLETRLEKMEKLLKSIGEGTDTDTESNSRKRHQSPIEVQQQTETTPKKSLRSKVVRYHGSSSGYYLVGNMLSNEKVSLSILQQQEKEKERKSFVVPSYNGKESYKLRKMNVNDNDLMVVRDETEDEEAIQLAVDERETIDEIMPKSVLIALVNTYFKDAQTTLPVLEKNEYMDSFEGRICPPPAPLLTYAICTYSCFLLAKNDPIFKDAGVERDHIFQKLLDRSSILVRKEYLKPRIVIIQALILLCGHPTYSTGSYRNWILAGMAVRMAQDLGLHRTLTTIEVSNEFKERRKKLWYSAYCTDRWCCAVMGRPLAIADSDCDVDLPLIQGPDKNEDLTMFVNFVKLSGILGEILRRIYSPKAKLDGYKTKSMEQTVLSLQKMLEEWFINVPDGYKITEQDILDMRINPQLYAGTKKVTEGGPMTICYHAVVLLLHRPFIVLDKDDIDLTSFSRATELCTQAAKLAIDVARSIPCMTIAKFGWNFAAYSVFQAALIHVYNCTSKDPQVAKEAKEYVSICINECLAPLGKDIPSGPPLIPFLETISSLLKTDSDNNVTEGSSSQQQQQLQTMNQQQQQQPSIASIMSNNGHVQPQQPEEPNIGSWLLNGDTNGNPALSQTTWQQLFSTAGTPFSSNDKASRGFDGQCWDNYFAEKQSSNNMFMP